MRAIFAAQLRAALIVLAKFRDTGRWRLRTYTDYRWIKSDSDAWPFSFVQVCLGLGLNPTAVREYCVAEGLLSTKLSERVYGHEHPPRSKRGRSKAKRKKRPGASRERRRRKRERAQARALGSGSTGAFGSVPLAAAAG